MNQENVDRLFDDDAQAEIEYLNYEYLEDTSDIQKEIEYKKYNKPGTDAVILDNDYRIFIIDHSNDKEYYDNRTQGSPGFGIRAVFDLNNITEDGIKEIVRLTASDHNYSAERIYRLLQNLGIKREYYNSVDIDAELKGIIDRNTRIYGKDRRKWRTSGYVFRGQNNNDGKSSIRIEGSLGQKTDNFLTPQGELYGFVDRNGTIHLDFSKITAEHPIHEYTHLWDRAVQQRNPQLWNRGVELMRQLDLWNGIKNDSNYGRKWIEQAITGKELDNRIASEVHARLVGKDVTILLARWLKDNVLIAS